MATNLPSCFSIQFLEQLLKFLVIFTLLKYVKSQRSYGFLITKELIFGFQILDLKDHFSASLKGHGFHGNKATFLYLGTEYSLSVLSGKLCFLEIGPEHQKLWSFKYTMLKTLNSNFFECEDTSTSCLCVMKIYFNFNSQRNGRNEFFPKRPSIFKS